MCRDCSIKRSLAPVVGEHPFAICDRLTYNIWQMSDNASLLERLASGPLLCDGAMGTQLFARGIGFEQCFDYLNLSQPELVQQIHAAYIDAGSDLIETNTFGANAVKLRGHGLEQQVAAINEAGVRLARRAAVGSGRSVFVLGAVGPLGRRLAPLGSLSMSEAADAFNEQISALVAAEPDALILETISDLNEMRLAIAAVKANTSLPIIAQMTFGVDARTLMGNTPEEFADVARSLAVDVMGVNCSVGPGKLLPVVEAIVCASHGIPVSAQPNAGWPEQVGDRLLYPSSPDYFAVFARRAVSAGVRIVGGCCGTTPDHIRAMRDALDEVMRPGPAAPAPQHTTPSSWPSTRVPRPAAGSRLAVKDLGSSSTSPGGPTHLQQWLSNKKFVVSVEIDPPKSADASALLAAAETLRQGGVDVLNVADAPMARMRMSAWAVCYLVQSQVGMETVLHFPTRGRNLLRVQGDLLAAHALGIRNILVVMGDPTSHGDYPQATDQSDIVPSGLVRLIKQQFNTGMDHASKSIGRATTFHVGVALNMAAGDLEKEAKTLRKKAEAGADYALTQPVYEPGVCARFIAFYQERYGPLPMPILVGLMPLASVRNAEFIHNEVPGLQLPLAVLERMRGAGKRGRREGIRICQELMLEARELVQGVYVMPTLERYDSVMEIMEVLPRTGGGA
jgi:methionine synthase I (cobalamin-dependent)/5,10-methylenetetrahydrofolate reductase